MSDDPPAGRNRLSLKNIRTRAYRSVHADFLGLALAVEALQSPLSFPDSLHLSNFSTAWNDASLDRSLVNIINEAVRVKAELVEIIPGKGSGQLKKRVLRFLDQKEIKALYHRVEKDSDNWGRLFVHFRWSESSGRRR